MAPGSCQTKTAQTQKNFKKFSESFPGECSINCVRLFGPVPRVLKGTRTGTSTHEFSCQAPPRITQDHPGSALPQDHPGSPRVDKSICLHDDMSTSIHVGMSTSIHGDMSTYQLSGGQCTMSIHAGVGYCCAVIQKGGGVHPTPKPFSFFSKYPTRIRTTLY